QHVEQVSQPADMIQMRVKEEDMQVVRQLTADEAIESGPGVQYEATGGGNVGEVGTTGVPLGVGMVAGSAEKFNFHSAIIPCPTNTLGAASGRTRIVLLPSPSGERPVPVLPHFDE